MFVYAYFTRDGGQHLQAFNKADRAADYAYNQINAYVVSEEMRYAKPERIDIFGPADVGKETTKELPPELIGVKKMLDDIKNDKTVEKVQKLIETYEEYCRYVHGRESPLHSLKDIQVVE